MNARKKMKLDPDVLRVDSFDTASGGGEARGTVHGLIDTDSCTNFRWGCSTCCFTVPLEMCSTKCVDPDTQVGTTTGAGTNDNPTTRCA